MSKGMYLSVNMININANKFKFIYPANIDKYIIQKNMSDELVDSFLYHLFITYCDNEFDDVDIVIKNVINGLNNDVIPQLAVLEIRDDSDNIVINNCDEGDFLEDISSHINDLINLMSEKSICDFQVSTYTEGCIINKETVRICDYEIFEAYRIVYGKEFDYDRYIDYIDLTKKACENYDMRYVDFSSNEFILNLNEVLDTLNSFVNSLIRNRLCRVSPRYGHILADLIKLKMNIMKG